jgi:ketosteroid isomerase-like protein
MGAENDGSGRPILRGTRHGRNTAMASDIDTARAFFEACETGKGWEGCRAYCAPDATFAAQSEPLAEVRTLQQYADWMKGILTVLTDGHYELKSFAADPERGNVCAFATFIGTHLTGGPVPPTGKTTRTDYVYIMEFKGGRIAHMTKVWNSGHALKELGWA